MENNYLSYLKWHGDLSFQEYSFNEIDNIILSELAYFRFDHIIPCDDKIITIKAAYDKLERMNKKHKKAGLFSPSISTLQRIAQSPRFAHLMLSHYVNKYDEKNMQFAAMKICIDENLNYVAFRGTDDTLTGWKEDFSISFEIVPSQKEASTYLDQVLDIKKQNIVGGHSKGGHLAVYGAMMCNDTLKSCISKIYSNDGPGVCQELIDMRKYEMIKDKIIKIIPEFSVVGLLFEKLDNPQLKIVKSNNKGILQHDPLNWQVNCQTFVEGKIINQAYICNTIFDEWIGNVDMKDRHVFVNDLFDALSVKCAKTLTDLSNQGVSCFEDILNSIVHSQKKSKQVFVKLLKSTFNRIKNIDYLKLFKEKEFL